MPTWVKIDISAETHTFTLDELSSSDINVRYKSQTILGNTYDVSFKPGQANGHLVAVSTVPTLYQNSLLQYQSATVPPGEPVLNYLYGTLKAIAVGTTNDPNIAAQIAPTETASWSSVYSNVSVQFPDFEWILLPIKDNTAVLSHINYDIRVPAFPDNPNGFKLPTYGLYGGPGYSGGILLNGQQPDFTKLGIDALDETFRPHDMDYTTAEKNYARTHDEHAFAKEKIIADLALLSRIKMIPDDQMNSAAHLYAGFTICAFVQQVLANSQKYLSPIEMASLGIDFQSMSSDLLNASHNISYAYLHDDGTLPPQGIIRALFPAGLNILGQGPLTDNLHYWISNPDVAASNQFAADHYNNYGWHEGRDPNAFYSTNGYLAANSDVAKAGLNPLTHYDTNGWKEGRDPSAYFDNELYLKNNPDVAQAGLDPLAHYLQYGQAEGRQAYAAIGKASSFTHGSFDAEYYLLANPDVAKAALASGGDTFAFALQHYQSSGWKEGRAADAYFDSTYYLTHNPDIAAAHIDPLAHYDQYGWKEGRNASAAFNTNAYLAANPDVAAAHIDPLTHYLQYGANEGRHLA